MQEEWKKEKSRREAWEKEHAEWMDEQSTLQNKVNELGSELQKIKEPTIGENNEALSVLKDENASLKKNKMIAMQAALEEKHTEREQEILKWTAVVKKGAPTPKREVISDLGGGKKKGQ